MDFTLDQLLALDAISRTGSFAGAAAELHRVPSAISYLVRNLETALDVPLFDRSRRRSTLTKAGERVLASARQVLEGARALEQVAVGLAGGWEAELHVVLDGALPMAPVAACLRRFATSDVPTDLRIDVEFQEGALDRFRDAPADIILFLGFDPDEDASGFDLIALPDLELVFVATPDHPLATGQVSEEARAAHAELVVRDSSARFARQAKASFIGSRNVMYLSDFHAKRVALLEGAGYGWIPHHLVRADLAAGRLVVLDAALSRWTYHPQIGTRAGQPLGRGARLFIDTLVDAVSV